MDDVTGGIVRHIGPTLPCGYGTCAKASNGRLYAIPGGTGRVLEIDPSSRAVRELGEECKAPSSGWAYLALIEADNGCLYAPPCKARRVLEVNPEAGTVRQIGQDLGETTLDCGHYISIALAANGCLYAPPAHPRGKVLEINPATGQVDLIGEELAIGDTTGELYRDIVPAQTGLLYAVPCNADSVLEISPMSRTVSSIGEPFQPGRVGKYMKASVASNGRLYANPRSASHVMEVDPVARTARQVGEAVSETLGCGSQCWSQADGGGLLWSITTMVSDTPLAEAVFFTFDPQLGTHDLHPIKVKTQTITSENAKYYVFPNSITRGGNGRLYAFPSSSGYALEIDPDFRLACEIGEPLPSSSGYWSAVTAKDGQVLALPRSPGRRIVQIDYLSLPQHLSRVHDALISVLSSGEYSDVTIRTSAKTYRTHKLILVLRSRVFKSMFAAKMREAQDALVELGDVSTSVSDMFMKYLYSESIGSQRISVQELCELSALAHRYEIDDLVETCARMLKENISLRSAAHLLRLADRLQCADLKQACLDFIVANQDVMDTDEWDEVASSPALVREVLEAMTGRRCKKRRLGDREFSADTDWTTLTVPKLRRACAERGLGQDGERESLLERLQA